jgi:DNA helicase II / ATP-dependent DNA helicase PcrA
VDDTSQLEVIYESPLTSIFVTAPPGYGKTFVMTERVKFLLSKEQIQPPKKILALTFSNAAANELKERIRQQIQNSDRYIDVMTFHTLAYSILKTYGNHIDLNRNFSIVSEKSINGFKERYFRTYLTKNGVFKENEIYDLIKDYNDWYKKKFIQKIEDYNSSEHLFSDLKKKIDEKFIDKDNLNFDNLLFKCIDLLTTIPQIQDAYYNKYEMIFADEFQDTNLIQYLLFKQLAYKTSSEKRIVFAVGDKRQAIMKFQGADPKNIDLLKRDFDCIEKELKINHRTDSPAILTITKKLRDFNLKISPDIRFKLYIHNTIDEESEKIIKKIRELIVTGIKLHDICILYPQNKTIPPLKKKLIENKIEYFILGDFKYDTISSEYTKIFEELENLVKMKYNAESVNKILKRLVKTHYPGRSEDPVIINLEKFSLQFDSSDKQNSEVWKRIQEYCNFLQMEIDWTKFVKTQIQNKIFLSTIHGSKGLEFPYVFMLGIVNFRLPHSTTCFPCGSFTKTQEVDISESEDLFYVGISRSIKDVIFFYSLQDEQNPVKSRKISCLFTPLIEMLQIIDSEGNPRLISDPGIGRFFCSKRN